MRKLTFINLIIASVLILASCSTSNNVVSNKLISKRKYTKGFHVNKKANYKASKNTVAEKEEIETPNYVVTSSDRKNNETPEVLEATQLKQAESNVAQETGVANEIDEKSTNKIVTEENQSLYKELGSKITRTISYKELTNRIKKAASSNSDLSDLLVIILLVILIIIVFSFLDAQLGGILGLILAIVLIWLILRYLGVI